MPGKSITMHAPHWLHLTAFNCNGPHEMSTAYPSRQTRPGIFFDLPLSPTLSLHLSLSLSLFGLSWWNQSRCLRLWFTFLRLTQKEKQNDVVLDFSVFHVLHPVQVFLLGFPAIVKGTKTTLMSSSSLSPPL